MNQLPNNTPLTPQKASLFGKTSIGSNRNFDLEVIHSNHVTPASEVESDIYFYHTDHLGSSSWITYTDGSVTQHMQNLPFGEPFIDQRATSYDIRFKFTGKEMDTETGYQYFGARYYDSDISVWLSVDPLVDKNLGISPYNYCNYSPLIVYDPDGRDGIITIEENEDGSGGSITISSTIHVYGKGAKEAVANANKKFSELNNSSVVDVDGKQYNVKLDINYVYSEELDNMDKDFSELTYSDLDKLSSFKKGDNVLQVGVNGSETKIGVLGESQRGGTFGYSYSIAGVDVVHESLHNIGLFDTYSGCCTPKKGFELDIMSTGRDRGQEINNYHFQYLASVSSKMLNYYKKSYSEGFRQKDFSINDSGKNILYTIIYSNSQFFRRK